MAANRCDLWQAQLATPGMAVTVEKYPASLLVMVSCTAAAHGHQPGPADGSCHCPDLVSDAARTGDH